MSNALSLLLFSSLSSTSIVIPNITVINWTIEPNIDNLFN